MKAVRYEHPDGQVSYQWIDGTFTDADFEACRASEDQAAWVESHAELIDAAEWQTICEQAIAERAEADRLANEAYERAVAAQQLAAVAELKAQLKAELLAELRQGGTL